MTVYNWEDVIIYIIYYIEPDFVYKGFWQKCGTLLEQTRNGGPEGKTEWGELCDIALQGSGYRCTWDPDCGRLPRVLLNHHGDSWTQEGCSFGTCLEPSQKTVSKHSEKDTRATISLCSLLSLEPSGVTPLPLAWTLGSMLHLSVAFQLNGTYYVTAKGEFLGFTLSIIDYKH